MNALAAIHVAKKQLNLDEETYRAVLVRVGGKPSAKDMSDDERKRVVEHFRKQGFTQAPRGLRKPLTGPFAKKLQALWIGAWNLGITRSADDAALIAFVKRQTGLDHVRFLTDPELAASAIEGLKSWMTREAGVQWQLAQTGLSWREPSAIIALAQATLFGQAGHVLAKLTFRQFIETESGVPLEQMSRLDWQNVTVVYGKIIRKELRK